MQTFPDDVIKGNIFKSKANVFVRGQKEFKQNNLITFNHQGKKNVHLRASHTRNIATTCLYIKPPRSAGSLLQIEADKHNTHITGVFTEMGNMWMIIIFQKKKHGMF